MHAYIDMEAFAGLQADAALRQLLKTFRLPGELCTASTTVHYENQNTGQAYAKVLQRFILLCLHSPHQDAVNDSDA